MARCSTVYYWPKENRKDEGDGQGRHPARQVRGGRWTMAVPVLGEPDRVRLQPQHGTRGFGDRREVTLSDRGGFQKPNPSRHLDEPLERTIRSTGKRPTPNPVTKRRSWKDKSWSIFCRVRPATCSNPRFSSSLQRFRQPSFLQGQNASSSEGEEQVKQRSHITFPSKHFTAINLHPQTFHVTHRNNQQDSTSQIVAKSQFNPWLPLFADRWLTRLSALQFERHHVKWGRSQPASTIRSKHDLRSRVDTRTISFIEEALGDLKNKTRSSG